MKYNKPPPNERPNWHRLNEGQRRYAWEQYNLALVRRGIPINHPIPGTSEQQAEPDEPNIEDVLAEPQPEPDHQLEEAAVEDFDEGQFEAVSEELPHNDTHETTDRMADGGGVKRPADTTHVSGPNKRRTGSNRKLPGTAADAVANEAGVREGPVPRPMVSIHSYTRYYRKVHRFLTYGLSYNTISQNIDAIPVLVITTPLCEIPWNRPFLYLNPSEFKLLPAGASFTRMKVSIVQRNVRIAFPTNSTANNLATLNQNKNIIYAHGLNKKITGMPIKYTGFEENQPMIPTSFDLYGSWTNTINDMYGPVDFQAGFGTVVPRHEVGIPQVLPYYFGMIYAPDRGTSNTAIGWENLQEHYTEVDADSTVGSTICDFEYVPRVGLCKAPPQPIWKGFPVASVGETGNNLTVTRGSMALQPHNTNVTFGANSNGTASNVTDLQTPLTPPGVNDFFIDTLIEKSQSHYHGLFMRDLPAVQESLHVGCQPTVALTTANLINDLTNSSFTDSQAYFEITAECEIDTAYPTFRTQCETVNTKEGNQWFRNPANTIINENFPLFDGLFTTRTTT